ncbi:SBBP repeat-containing protein [Leptospira sp. 2 VSF19]|uniref:SBBP repeat-containing protein n=1 Tax=Leptospira soteropolitanensis TaxID=2950025 RepID=A0AAW5VCE0_9LEPT|nr:SBBP repeat-containing protein [Leptospira soteropolitanensis]MCW7491726.1 SBBP repeat-containing protein [Leptospira soteropolitanensis]MCW7499311.1 SBBP repeat-containing protein [Leptospira soteropolitanensis]MCW7521098.1 SBBP repeat-containing protein [Leptospira soteropolitanensis]MCW7525414.1 SBBP repeat-containing protein [Leptospira soteropolitanensis]MCW7529281.1 SBBP repeat-containing protein [Leptospira soteropolitanensis]
MELLRCLLGEIDCIEIPQDNQGIKQWTKFLGATGGVLTAGQSTATDRSGNVYLVGTTTGSLAGQPKISPSSYNDILIAKFDSNGNLLWVRQVGSTGIASTYAEVAHFDKWGDLYIVGSSGGPFNEYSGNGAGSLLLKVHPSGLVLWTRIFPTGSETLGSGVTTDTDGNVYITGNTEEQVINGETALGGRNTFIFKYSRGGDYIWTRLIDNGGPSSYGQQMQYDSYSKSILIAGQVGGTGTFFGNSLPGGLMDSYLLSLSTNGNIQWVRLLGVSGGTTSARAISVDQKGSVYITGDANADIDGQTKSGSIVQFLTRYKVSGEKVWTRLLGGGGSSNTFSYGIYADNASHIYTVGSSTGNLPGFSLVGTQDSYLSKYDANGNLIWIRISGNSSSTIYGRGISSDKYGTLYVSGSTDGSFDGQIKQGTNDAFLSKYQ